jgi:hypothetical protein
MHHVMKDGATAITMGGMALMIVIYRIIFIMSPMVSMAVKSRDVSLFFKSLTLLV